jgi:GDP-4-dehydro-6-deoxy-D-mannose reductase
MERILVTGASGFTGRHLLSSLLAALPEDTEISGVDLNPGNLPERVSKFACDLTDSRAVISLIREASPTRIFHLGGTFTNQMETDYAGNVVSARNIFEAVMGMGEPDCRMLVVGSAAEYGYVACEGQAVTEDSPLRPVSIYGLTKTFQTALAQFYARVHGLGVVIVRPFNLIGCGVSSRLFIGSLCEQIAALKTGHAKEIRLGDLSGARDYIDINDAVKAYQIVMELGKPGEVFNIGSGVLTPIRQLVDLIVSRCGMEPGVVRVLTGSYRPSDASPSFCADMTKLRSLGWSPEIGMEESAWTLVKSLGLV